MNEDKTMMQQFIEVVKDDHDHLFDFIANNYWKFNKEELKDICKELLYGIYYAESRGYITSADSGIIYESVTDELENLYNEED